MNIKRQFHRPPTRLWHCILSNRNTVLGGLVVVAFALFGAACETVPQRSGAAKLNSKKVKAAKAEADKDRPEVILEEPLSILRVNPDYGWLVARSGQNLPEGMKLSTWHGEEETARLVVAERNRHPFYILEVTHGDPHPRDVLVIAGPEEALKLPDNPNPPVSSGLRSTGSTLFKPPPQEAPAPNPPPPAP